MLITGPYVSKACLYDHRRPTFWCNMWIAVGELYVLCGCECHDEQEIVENSETQRKL